MVYLLDANVLIDAHRDYYPIDRVPEFWDWLVDCAVYQQTKIPLEMYEEVLQGRPDQLTRWLKGEKDTMVLDENVDRALVARVMACYGSDLNDEELQIPGRDPFLIAYALGDSTQRLIVTTEVSKPKRKGRKPPHS